MNLSVVVPNYNGQNVLEENLPRVIKSFSSFKDGSVEIIVVDDGSTDRSLEILEKFEKQGIKILRNEKNLGFSSTVNKGASHASGDILILLNTDVVPNEDFLKPLLSHFEDEAVFGVGCMDESVEEERVVNRGRGIGKWNKGFLLHSAGELDKNDTLWVSGGSGAFRKDIWDKLGGLDTLYDPFYWEDIDLSYRALKSGYKTVFEKKSVVRHEHEEGAIRKEFKGKVDKVSYRNQFQFVWLNVTDFKLLVSHLLWFPYHLLNTSLLFGFLSAIVRLPRIMINRQKHKKTFIKRDSEVLSMFNT